MIGYVAKDLDGEIYIHAEEPIYNNIFDAWFSSLDCINITGQFDEFNNISYKDEPIKVEINIKRVWMN